jgi:hypothetical protein
LRELATDSTQGASEQNNSHANFRGNSDYEEISNRLKIYDFQDNRDYIYHNHSEFFPHKAYAAPAQAGNLLRAPENGSKSNGLRGKENIKDNRYSHFDHGVNENFQEINNHNKTTRNNEKGRGSALNCGLAKGHNSTGKKVSVKRNSALGLSVKEMANLDGLADGAGLFIGKFC